MMSITSFEASAVELLRINGKVQLIELESALPAHVPTLPGRVRTRHSVDASTCMPMPIQYEMMVAEPLDASLAYFKAGTGAAVSEWTGAIVRVGGNQASFAFVPQSRLSWRDAPTRTMNLIMHTPRDGPTLSTAAAWTSARDFKRSHFRVRVSFTSGIETIVFHSCGQSRHTDEP